MRSSKLALGIVLIAVTASAWAATYTELVPWSAVKGTSGGSSHYAAVVDGYTSYHQLFSTHNITRVDGINTGSPTTTVLVDAATWAAASGGASMATWYGFSQTGNFLQFSETATDAIWRVNKSTGALTTYVSKANIMALTGAASVTLLSPADTNPVTGEMAVYDGQAGVRAILTTAGPGTAAYLLTSAQLIAATGNDTVSGGLSYDAAGNLYWGTTVSDDLWRRNTDGTITQVLTKSQILAVTGHASDVGWKDIFAAPDGRVYFGDNSTGHILRFSPANPAGTLEIYLSSADLIAGPMGSNGHITFGWYYPYSGHPGGLTFHRFGSYGLYYIPEPASALLITLGLLFLRRR